jgi:hypothetical protein
MTEPTNDRFYQLLEDARATLDQIGELIHKRALRDSEVQDGSFDTRRIPAEYDFGRIMQMCRDALNRTST